MKKDDIEGMKFLKAKDSKTQELFNAFYEEEKAIKHCIPKSEKRDLVVYGLHNIFRQITNCIDDSVFAFCEDENNNTMICIFDKVADGTVYFAFKKDEKVYGRAY